MEDANSKAEKALEHINELNVKIIRTISDYEKQNNLDTDESILIGIIALSSTLSQGLSMQIKKNNCNCSKCEMLRKFLKDVAIAPFNKYSIDHGIMMIKAS